VQPPPALAFALVAALVHDDWTRGETFAVAHREPEAGDAGPCLRIRDGAPVIVGDSPAGEAPAATIVCPGRALLAVLDPASGAEATIEGDGRPLVVIQTWIKRAQSG
jgi:hypothetical protein